MTPDRSPPKSIAPPRIYPVLNTLRGVVVLVLFVILTLPLMPVQALFLKVSPRWARWLPHWYHRQVCRILGIKLKIQGGVVANRPVLLIANHTSWLDIPVLSAAAPVSFIAKKEVSSWPFVKTLAWLQRTVFVDRERRMATDATARHVADRLAAEDTIVLFAEGTSSDGNRVLPFRTSLFAAAKPSTRGADEQDSSLATTSSGEAPLVQTASVAYTRLHGLPLLRGERALVGWYGDMEMTSHVWALLKAGPLDVEVRFSPPVPLDEFADRKALAQHSEKIVRETVVRMLRAIPEQKSVETISPTVRPQGRTQSVSNQQATSARGETAVSPRSQKKWT